VTTLIIQYFGADTTRTYVLQTAELQEMYWGLCMLLAAILIFSANQKLNILTEEGE
jgi:hypothetical protein